MLELGSELLVLSFMGRDGFRKVSSNSLRILEAGIIDYGQCVWRRREPYTSTHVMSNFTDSSTALSAANTAVAVDELKQQLEDYAQQEWEREEARKEREE